MDGYPHGLDSAEAARQIREPDEGMPAAFTATSMDSTPDGPAPLLAGYPFFRRRKRYPGNPSFVQRIDREQI